MFFLSDEMPFSFDELLLFGAASGGKAIEDTATGNPLTFLTDLAKPLKSLSIPFTPQQTGSGDPSPSNIRPIVPWNGLAVKHGGKNLFHASNTNAFYFVDSRQVNVDDANNLSWEGTNQTVNGGFIVPCKPNTEYTYYIDYPSQLDGFYYRVWWSETETFTNTDQTRIVNKRCYNNNSASFTTPATAKYLLIGFYIYNVSCTQGATAKNIQLEVGQTATTYEPYVPITETDIVFPSLTSNLFSAEIEQGEYNYTYGYKQDSTTRIRSDYIPLKAGKYTISCTGMNNVVMYVFDTDKRFLVSESQRIWTNTTFTFTISDDRLVAFVWRKTGDVEITPSDISNVMLNTGETAKPYEPYTNSVYGGTLDVVSGVLTVEWVAIPMKNIEWDTTSATSVFTTPLDFTPLRNVSDKMNVLSDMFVTESSDTRIANMPNMSIKGHATAKYALCVRDEDFTRKTDFNAWLQTANPIMCFELDEPQTVQLTPEQITALVGNNTIWSDANGSMTAVYLKKA